MDDLRTVPLSVLDLAPVGTGSSHARALADTVDLARHADDLGFTRYWLAEHHGMPGIASSATAVLVGAVAAATRRIRVGSGGVMLPNHAPLVVAEQFGTLEALHPGRIDLGIGRAPGTDPATARALRRSAEALGADDFPQQLGELLGFFRGGFDPRHPYAGLTAVPGLGDEPAMWLLGSSGYSAQVAGMLGMPFAFAHHFSSGGTLAALRLYRDAFEPSAVLERPYAAIGVQVVAADDDERAHALAAPSALAFLRLRQGRPGLLPSPQEAAAHPWTPSERDAAAERWRDQAVGGPETVRARLSALLAATGADELLVTSMLHGHRDRVRSLETVRELFGSDLPTGLQARLAA